MKDNEKILKFSDKVKKVPVQKQEIKSFLGFDYIKSEKDANGSPFVKENLLEYADECRYMVKVMREKNKKVYLYNYYVHQSQLASFLIKIENGEIDGSIIEVEKYIPEDLA